MKVLVVGGAGYIGSHMSKMLFVLGHEVVIFDNLSTGHLWAAKKWGKFIQGDLLEIKTLNKLFFENNFDAVIHFAAVSLTQESLSNPQKYWTNNCIGTLNLINCMIKFKVNNLIFSSTAAIFGNPISNLIDEEHPKLPINTYGNTKLFVECLLKDYARAYGLNSVSLRYFNAAGADEDAEIGEAHEHETHLIPNLLAAAYLGSEVYIYGKDYNTLDGTCIRDYIHVWDLCQAHLKSITFIKKNNGAFSFNLGRGSGSSVLDVIKSVESVTGKHINYSIASRRPGDPETLVANYDKATVSLDWKCRYTKIEEIISTAWAWHKKYIENLNKVV